MTRALRLDPAQLSDARFAAALRSWHQLCGSSGLYPREQLGFGLLVGTPEVLNGHSCVIATDSADPMNFVIAYFGSDLDLYEGRNLVGQRLRDLPDRESAEAVAGCYVDAMAERQPIAHRIEARFGAEWLVYERVILPTVNARGEVDRLVTVNRGISRSRATTATAHAPYPLRRCG